MTAGASVQDCPSAAAAPKDRLCTGEISRAYCSPITVSDGEELST